LCDGDGTRVGDQAEADLATAGKLDIDLREQLSVEQGAVLDAMAAVDPEAHAQGVEAVLGARVPGTRERQRIDHAAHRHARPAAAFQLVIEEAEVEAGIVRDQRRIFDELEQLLGLLGKQRLVGQESVGEAVHHLGLERHFPFRVEICVEVPTGFDPVDDLDTADLDHSVAAERV